MTCLWLELSAPFAAFRPLQSGAYRNSSRCLPPSTAYGLVLGLAGVDMRDPRPAACTGIRTGLPKLRLALGQVRTPEVAVLFQQLHGYNHGPDGAGPRDRSGAKRWISPVRRELLVGFRAVLGVEAEPGLIEAIRAALAGHPGPGRHGLPFAGDNNLLFDRIEASAAPAAAHWLTPLGPADPPRPGSERLTVWIDRGDSARTRKLLMAPMADAHPEPPREAWLEFPGGTPTSSQGSDAFGR
jgi:CRISPR-associated protein Cas5t